MVPVVLQTEAYDCGRAVYESLCAYWRCGGPLPPGWPSSIDGTDPRVMEGAFRGSGLHCIAGEMTPATLKHLIRSRLPAACLIRAGDTSHWVVADDWKRRRLSLMDPLIGRVALPEAEFLNRWGNSDTDRTGAPYRNWAIVPWRLDPHPSHDS